MELVCADNLEGHEGSHHRDHTFHHIQKKKEEIWGRLSHWEVVARRFQGKSLASATSSAKAS